MNLLDEAIAVARSRLEEKRARFENPDDELYDDGAVYQDMEELEDLIAGLEQLKGVSTVEEAKQRGDDYYQGWIGGYETGYFEGQRSVKDDLEQLRQDECSEHDHAPGGPGTA